MEPGAKIAVISKSAEGVTHVASSDREKKNQMKVIPNHLLLLKLKMRSQISLKQKQHLLWGSQKYPNHHLLNSLPKNLCFLLGKGKDV